MANKTASIDFGDAMSRMRRSTKEERGGESAPHQPTKQQEYAPSRQQEYAQPQQEAPAHQPEPKRGPGRKPRENNVRTNGKTIYFDNETEHALAMVKANNRIDKKDLVLAATREFLAKYYNKEEYRLTNEGIYAIFSSLGKPTF